MMLTQEKLLEYLKYKDKKFFWRNKTSKYSNVRVGQRWGSLNTQGYWRGNLKEQHYYEHHLVWLVYKGYLPKFLDHINGDRRDNSIENLRESSYQTNNYNMRSSLNSSSKYKGVTWVKRSSVWQASIRRQGKQVFLGYFKTEEDAAKAYDREASKVQGEFMKRNCNVKV